MIKKTFKRELSIALLIWLGYIVETKSAEIIQVLVWPVFTFTALSFGLDWFSKSNGMQWSEPSEPSNWRRPQYSGQYTDRERELSSSSFPDNPDGD